MKILFVTSNRIGDALLSTGLLAHLSATYPDARFTIACGPPAAPLFAEVPNLDRILVMRKAKWAGHWLRLWRETIGTHWDIVVDLRASALAWMLVADRRFSFKPRHNDVHRVVQLAQLLKLAEPPMPKLWIGETQRRQAEDLIAEGGPVLAVGPTANWGGKQWPADRFLEAIHRLTAPDGLLPGARVAVFGAAHERPAAATVLEGLPAGQLIDLMGKIDLLTVHACLQRCAFYLGNDSGLMHIAAAAGIPTLGLFGPSNEALYAPWGPCTASVRTRRSFLEIISAPGYDPSRQDSLMADLSVDDVTAAAESLWRRCGSASQAGKNSPP